MEEEIEETLVSYLTAKLAKEKGFNLTVRAYFNVRVDSNDEPWIEDQDDPDDYNDAVFQEPRFTDCEIDAMYTFTSAPTQNLLQKWLREVHNIIVWSIPATKEDNIHLFTCFVADEIPSASGKIVFRTDVLPYEQALEIGLQEALKLI